VKIECDKKLDIHDRVPFKKSEIEFFKKFREENKNKYKVSKDYLWTDDHISGQSYRKDLESPKECSSISINLLRNYAREWRIIKLDDEWYLISSYDDSKGIDAGEYDEDYLEEEFTDYYICDEWEEVIGYLTSDWNKDNNREG
jgi:hypothetical protein